MPMKKIAKCRGSSWRDSQRGSHEAFGLTLNGLARELKVPINRLSEIVNGRRALNADAACGLSRETLVGTLIRE